MALLEPVARIQLPPPICGISKGRRDRLSRTLHDIWERASAGDHSDIDVTEARYLFLQTYIVLGELLALES